MIFDKDLIIKQYHRMRGFIESWRLLSPGNPPTYENYCKSAQENGDKPLPETVFDNAYEEVYESLGPDQILLRRFKRGIDSILGVQKRGGHPGLVSEMVKRYVELKNRVLKTSPHLESQLVIMLAEVIHLLKKE